MRTRDEATEAQVRSADPTGSTWLSANAGSGKTRVLTDRVARLLLRGVDPQQILCLTYTKAAASEMQNRLFKRLGAWAMLDDIALRDELWTLGEETPDDLARARTLFAAAVETPGGLKIQTIHSFCAGLLRRFPLEAGVNPQFEEMEDRAAELLRAEIVDQMIESEDAAAVRALTRHFTGDVFARLTAEIARHRVALSKPATWDDIAAQFEIAPGLTEAAILEDVCVGGELELLARIVPPMLANGGNDEKAAKLLSNIEVFDRKALAVLDRCFVVQSSGLPKVDKFPTQATQGMIAADMPALNAFIERVHGAREPLRRLLAAQKTFALRQFCTGFLARYEAAKRQRGWLDFDDLILKTQALLTNPAVADWVLFRLDGGISHILVDEAQDTSPTQWDVIRKLSREFTSGEGARANLTRTIFVVGDKKQSIYSFQGADPDGFDRMQQEFGTKLNESGMTLANWELNFSFRSSDAILRVVDRTFAGKGPAGFVTDQLHRAFHSDKPGRVDLWPVIESVKSEDDRKWWDPVDRRPDTHHTMLLAEQVADRIADMLDDDNPALIPDRETPGAPFRMRPVRPGDIMILMQTRKPLFHEIIRACKKRNLPVAGADRLRVGGELAVRDLLALLSFLATPEDSLSLATVLRSPLGGWSEKQVFDLAHGRAEPHLWETLRARRAAHSETYEMLATLRGQIDFLRPYDLLERILTRFRGREKLLGRLGREAEDGIDAILGQALAYERSAIPSLTGFLRWAETDDLEIKRQVDSTGDLIRVMTVHGAKGLEAPIVILPDCGRRDLTVKDELLADDDAVLWKTPPDDMPQRLRSALDRRKEAEARERMRLLYVAMTRAETWLIVAACGDVSSDGSDWYQTVRAGMEAVGAVTHTFPLGQGLRHEFGDWSAPRASDPSSDTSPSVPLEPFFRRPIAPHHPRPEPLSPSDLGGAKALSSDVGLPEDIALARGTYVHLLLEAVADAPQHDWDGLIRAVAAPPQLTDDLIQHAQAEARQARTSDGLQWVFAPGALSEVSVSGRIADTPILGTIDRLIVTAELVTAVDYKTNMSVPETPQECPEGILRQMGAYAAVLAQIYPGRRIATGILWTATARYMALPQNLVSAPAMGSPYLDGAQAAT